MATVHTGRQRVNCTLAVCRTYSSDADFRFKP